MCACVCVRECVCVCARARTCVRACLYLCVFVHTVYLSMRACACEVNFHKSCTVFILHVSVTCSRREACV